MYYEQFDADARKAIEHFQVLEHVVGDDSVYLRAQADTGSNYEVGSMRLDSERYSQDTWLVTVIQPWQNAWILPVGVDVDLSYVRAHFGNPLREIHHAGDLAAITIMIMMALGMDEDRAKRFLDYIPA